MNFPAEFHPVGDESSLIPLAKAGDLLALEQLLRPYNERIYRLAYRITGQREDAEDLAQEALFRVIQRLPSYRGEASFGTWLYRVALNACLSARKKRRISPEALEENDGRDPSMTPESLAIRAEFFRHFGEEILRISPACREAVLLRLSEELSYEEIGEMLHISGYAARMRVSRGLEQLRERLRPWIPVEGEL